MRRTSEDTGGFVLSALVTLAALGVFGCRASGAEQAEKHTSGPSGSGAEAGAGDAAGAGPGAIAHRAAPLPLRLTPPVALLASFAGEAPSAGAAPEAGSSFWPSRGLSRGLTLSALLPFRWGSQAPEGAALQAIAGTTLVGGHSYAYLSELTSGYGPRLTGSRAHAGAARWALETFRKLGVDDARLEEFDFASGWERGPVTLRALGPEGRQLAAEALGWAPSPRGGSLTAELVLIESLSEAAERAHELRGKALLPARPDTPRDLAVRQRAIKALSEAGVAAIVSRGRRHNNEPNARACFGCGSLVAPLPMVEVGFEDGAWLERRIKEGGVTINLANASRLTGPLKVPNVIAEVRGRERPDEYVLVGAHLDAWDFATGAQDDGAGVAQVIETARAVLASGVRPRRSIRFALWAGEEQGLYGSRAYVKRHARELDRLVAVVNADHGAGAPRGWWLDARPDLLERFGPLAKRLFGGLGAAQLKDEFHCDTDHCPFVLEGVPTFDLEVEEQAYDEVHHAPSDTLDEVNERDLAAGAACVATAAYALADLPERVGPRLSHDKVTENLRASGALDDLIAEGLYAP
ncbi:MAG TPA: M20/M25/M40 family metallo-hydrolase [Polyangiaceae bacterium]|nr:M20/M25/M40 family metallo-hydrolase [Polyangiaceae bacterium]